MNTTSDKEFIFTYYRSAWLQAVLISITTALVALSLWPQEWWVFLCGLAGAGLLFWLSETIIVQGRAVDLVREQIVDLVFFRKSDKGRTFGPIADFEQIAAVWVQSRRSWLYKQETWEYPIYLLTWDGREIVLANWDKTLHSPIDSLVLARQVARAIGCEVLFGGAETPTQAKVQAGQATISPKVDEVGLGGRIVMVTAIFGLLSGLVYLAP